MSMNYLSHITVFRYKLSLIILCKKRLCTTSWDYLSFLVITVSKADTLHATNCATSYIPAKSDACEQR